MSDNWTCPKCGRIFAKKGQIHSCKKVSKDFHFKGKEEIAVPLYKDLLTKIKRGVGPVKEIILPCCIHLFGKNDFIAILPKKDRLELRFALGRELKNSRMKKGVWMSKKRYKNVLDVHTSEEIDKKLLGWLKESYNLE